jgi:hypothetical protein
VPYATATDYTARYGADPTGHVATVLVDAESLMREFAGNRFDGNALPAWVTGLACTVAHRALTNDEGLKSVSFVDAYSASFANPSTGLFLTVEEQRLLAGPVVA